MQLNYFPYVDDQQTKRNPKPALYSAHLSGTQREAQEIADHYRKQGYRARCHFRVVKADTVTIQLWVVIARTQGVNHG